MFTGIIESLGKISSVRKEKGNITFSVECDFANELKEGQSVAHNGVCLTVTSHSPGKAAGGKDGAYTVTAIKETLDKTNLGKLKSGDEVNLERSLKVGDRMDGHFVQGHVDCTAEVHSVKEEKGSHVFEFSLHRPSSDISHLIIEKGSICINGVSLTIVAVNLPIPNSQLLTFSVAIIPHTFMHTNFHSLKEGDAVNIEFDILGKHIQKIMNAKPSPF